MDKLWFRKVGFGRNPFSIKPAALSYELFGASIDNVISGIEEGKLLFVEAPLGYGKTTLLKSIIHRFGGRKKVVYAHVLPSERLDVKGLLKRSSIAGFITGSLPSNMILVVDEAQYMLPESSAEIMEFYRSGSIRAAVFFGTTYPRNLFANELGAVLNGNIIRLSKPTPEQALSMVRSRIGSLPLISNDDILSAYKKVQGSPRRLLQVCEDICRAAVEGDGTLVAAAEELPAVAAEVRPRRTAKKAKAPRQRRKKVAARRPVQPSPSSLPELLVEDVSSTPAVSVSEISLQKPGQRPRRKPNKKAAAGAAVKAKPAKKSRPAGASQPKRKSRQKPESPLSVAAEQVPEGRYWGEFMGMQK